jgi:quinol monooxygenase YgiN
MMVAIALRLVARAERRQELLDAVRNGLLTPTRDEPGCLRYRFYQDVEDENAFSFVEEWDNWEALGAHIRSAHVGAFLAALGDRLAEPPEARFYEVARVRGAEVIDEARGALPRITAVG